LQKQAGKEDKKQHQHTDANSTRKSAAKEAKKSPLNEAPNSTAKSVAKEDPNEPNNMKAPQKQKVRLASKKLDTEVAREFAG
jgi:hypothetical protein